MNIKLGNVRRLTYGLAAFAFTAVLGASMVVPGLLGQAAAAQVTTRSIKMSSSVASASAVSYEVTFTPATSRTNPDIIIDFCSNTPIIGDTCTATAGTDTPSFASASASAGWTLATIGSNRGVKLTTSTLSLTASTPVTITLSGVINPSAVGSFYARIITYTTGGAGSNTSASPGTYTDYGGVALSTANQVSITAKVMETLTFCVSGGTITNCGTTTTPALSIGHGTNTVLDNTAVDVASAYTQLSTNAQSGAVVRMKASNTCTNGGLSNSGGTTCNIPGVGGGNGTAATIAAGTAAFGMCVGKGTNTTVASTYNDSVNSCPTTFNATSLYGVNGTNVTSTYGDQIFSTSGAVSAENNRCTYAATAGLTTPAGLYTANQSLIATGTF